MNVRTLRFSALGTCLLAIGAVALKTTGDTGYAPPPPPPNGYGGVIQSCGPDNYVYCHGELFDSSITYQSTNTFPIAVLFNGGSLEPCCDWLQVYDGLDNFAPMIGQYTGSLDGLFFASNNPSNALFLVWHTDGSISCQSGSYIQMDWTVSCLDCTAPQATFQIDLNCEQSYFNVLVNVLAMGTDPSIDITNTGGAATVVATAPGTYTVGPFTPGAEVEVTLENELNPLCNVNSGVLTNYPCPIISCGPNTYDYCYENADTYIQIFQGTTTYPLRLQFNSGGIYQWDGDLLTIYDGLDESGGILYQGTGVNGDLTDLFWTSTNLDHALMLKMVSTDFTGCADGNAAPWNYTVGCLDCTPPSGTAGVVTTDCDAQSYTVTVNITDLGTDPQIEIGNDIGVPPNIVTAPGTYEAGPYPVGVPATITLVNDANALCNVELGTFENSFCPIIITCGEPAFEDQYCYAGADAQSWLYTNTGTEPLALLFSAGTIESDTWDHLTIYDGIDNTAETLWTHANNFFTEPLAGVLAISTGNSIYMEMSSDFSVSCADGGFGIEEWFWTVGCLDCTQPDVLFDVVLDCDSELWYISSIISDVGSDPTITITNTYDTGVIPVTAPGTYLSGPFPFGAVARVELVTDSNTLCSRRSDYTTNPPCPFVSCAPAQYEYCYPNVADTAMTYQSDNAYPIAMVFNSGQMNTYGDSIYVYDGANYLAPLLFSGFNVTGDLSGLLFTSSNPANALTMKIRSDFFTSCVDMLWTPMNWSVQCLDCTNPTASFSMVPDCLHNGFLIQVDVDSLGQDPPYLRIANSLNTDTVENVQVGTTFVGPFPADSVVSLTVMNSENALCRRVSEVFTYPSDSCVNVACTPTGEEYCYVNADTAWFVYTSGTTDPVTINFLYGELLVNDYIQIYNGLDTSAQIVYMGNQGGQLDGLAISSNNPDNALTLLVISSQAGSCASGQGFPPLYWEIGCGLVGENEFTVDGFAMFPNPTNGDLYVRLADGITGMVNIDVLDITGRVVMSERFNAAIGRTERFDMGALTNGNYAVRLSTTDWAKTEQLQVVR